MSNNWDASIKLLYPADAGAFFTVDTIKAGEPFVAIANVEIGEDLNKVVTRFDLRIGVVNLTQATSVTVVSDGGVLTPDSIPVLAELRVPVDTWTADVGDVLKLVASYKVTAGIHTDSSSAESVTFIVD